MQKTRKHIAALTVALAAALLLAGCGGGGGSTPSPAALQTGKLRVSLKLPRQAFQTQGSYVANIDILSMSATGTLTPVAETSTPLFPYETTGTYGFIGAFEIQNVPEGNNYVAKVSIVESYTVSNCYSATSSASCLNMAGCSWNASYCSSGVARQAQTTTTYTRGHVGALVNIVAGDWNVAVITPESSVTALATMRYALNHTPALALADVPASAITAIDDVVISDPTSVNDFLTAFLLNPNDPFTATSLTGASTMGSVLDTVIDLANLVDLVPPTVLSFSPAAGATTVPVASPAFKVVFSESMDSTVNLNATATLDASNFSITLVRLDTGGSLTINAANAQSYGTFAWTTTTAANDTLQFTLKSPSALTAAGLKALAPGKTYTITAPTVPINLKDLAGNPLNRTIGVPTSGSFTTSADTTAPTVSSFSPAAGATNVAFNSPQFKVIFSESMTPSNFNTSPVLLTSGFSITLQRQDTGGTITITPSNALSYGTFSWATTNVSGDTLVFTLHPSPTLEANNLKALVQGKTYNVTSRTVPTNLTDLSGNPLTTTGIISTGSFTVFIDTTAPTVLSFSPANGASGVAIDGPQFKVIFSESMTPIDYSQTPNILSSGFSISLQRQDTGGTLTITPSNSFAYGTFSWETTNVLNDTFVFTLKPSSQLELSSLKTLAPNKTYNITSRTVPTNLTDLTGNSLSATGIASTGSFTTGADTPPTVVGFTPVTGAMGVPWNIPVFEVQFSKRMDTTVDLNNSTMLSASGFSISLQRQDTGGTLTINASNALSYGTFAWATNVLTDDSLTFTLKPDSLLFVNNLKRLAPNTQYNITSRTVPTNLKDFAGTALSATGIPTTGSFTTGP